MTPVHIVTTLFPMDTEIKFRVAAADKARLQRAAGRAGRSLSDWVRRVSLAAVDVELGVVIPPVPLAIQEPGKIVTPKVLPKDPKAVEKIAAGSAKKAPRPRTQVDPDKIAEAQKWLTKKK